MQKQGSRHPAPLRHHLSAIPGTAPTRRPQVQGDEAVSPCLPNMAEPLLRKMHPAVASGRLAQP
jgi:hypothetical protein